LGPDRGQAVLQGCPQVGHDDQPRFTEVVVWRTDSGDGRDGPAELAAEVKSSDSFHEEEVAEWVASGQLPALFRLVVPAGSEPEAIPPVKKKAVRFSQLRCCEIVGGAVIRSQFPAPRALEEARVLHLE